MIASFCDTYCSYFQYYAFYEGCSYYQHATNYNYYYRMKQDRMSSLVTDNKQQNEQNTYDEMHKLSTNTTISTSINNTSSNRATTISATSAPLAAWVSPGGLTMNTTAGLELECEGTKLCRCKRVIL